jgi:hypothetical protein
VIKTGFSKLRDERVPPSAQTPLSQDDPPGQVVLQLPQFLSSVFRLTQSLPHSRSPPLHLHFFPLQVVPLQQSLFLSHFLFSFLQARALSEIAKPAPPALAIAESRRRRDDRSASSLVIVSNYCPIMAVPPEHV